MLRSCASLLLLALVLPSNVIAGHPCAHVLICCRGSNNGTTFEVNGSMIPNHDYSDIGQTRDILQKIKDAGIQTVIIDMTNASQWTQLWSTYEPKVDNIRKVTLETGVPEQERLIESRYFGEGIIDWKDRLIELTWKHETGFIYDIATFEKLGEFSYPGEGWALTRDDRRLIMSDGTASLRFLDPETLKETGRVQVTDAGRPVDNLNELEWVKGEVFANIWQTDLIARMAPLVPHGRIAGVDFSIEKGGALGVGEAAASAYRELRHVQHRARLNEEPTQVAPEVLAAQRDAILALGKAVFG